MILRDRVFAITLGDLLKMVDSAVKVALVLNESPDMEGNMTEERISQLISLGFISEIEPGQEVDVPKILEDRQETVAQEKKIIN